MLKTLNKYTVERPVERVAGAFLPCVGRLYRPGLGRAGPCLEHMDSRFGYRESAANRGIKIGNE